MNELLGFDLRGVTFLCADAPDDQWTSHDVSAFAARFGGSSQAGEDIAFVLSFANASSALRAALTWQRMAGGGRPRVALFTADCAITSFHLDPEEWSRTFNAGIAAASRLALATAAGTISVSPETYATVREQIAREVRDAIVLTEMDDNEVTHACIVLAPEETAELSTFAGLGLTT